MDGWITLGTKVDTEELDKQIKQMQNKLRRNAKETEKLLEQKAQIEYDFTNYDDLKQQLSDTRLKMEQLNQAWQQGVSVQQYKEMEAEYRRLEDHSVKLSKEINKQKESYEKQQETLDGIELKLFDIAKENKIINSNISSATQQLKNTKNLNNINSSLKGIVKTTTKWALAVFSVRSAYLFIRRAVGTISEYDDELASKIKYISVVIAYALKPVIEWIVDAVYKLLAIIGGVLKGLFGINIFTEEANKAFKGMNKSAKDLKKTLAGFDEMNVLADTSGSGGGTGSSIIPEIPDGTKYEENAKRFKDMWNEMLEADRVGTYELLTNSDKTWGILKFGWFDTIQGLVYAVQGLVDFIIGIGKIIVGLVTGDTELVNKGISQTIKGIIEGLRGLLQFFEGLVYMLIGLIWGAIKSVSDWVGNLIKNTKISFKELGSKAGEIIGGAFKNVVNAILRTIENVLNSPIRTINSLIRTINKIPGINIGTLGTFSLPRLAKGAIASYPGRGIPTTGGGARWAEAGQEAYLPLTDSQFLSRLGQSIGEYVTINANITNTMNGRVISRELQKINSENDFAYNR